MAEVTEAAADGGDGGGLGEDAEVVVLGRGDGAEEDEERLERDTRLSRASNPRITGPRLRSTVQGALCAFRVAAHVTGPTAHGQETNHGSPVRLCNPSMRFDTVLTANSVTPPTPSAVAPVAPPTASAAAPAQLATSSSSSTICTPSNVRVLSGNVRGSSARTGFGTGAGAGVPREASRVEGERGKLAKGQRKRRSRNGATVVVAGALGSSGKVGNGGGERRREEPAAAEEANRKRHGVRHVDSRDKKSF
ncbi:hypothetical protein U9M48_029590 [Paspalum notatum var. saurae]|uniref:Uncharacterized protein n=1 Tax=Paspalum notatum var. saurae TaxID=547442 RepID=A0AAQ3X1R2_PASNO